MNVSSVTKRLIAILVSCLFLLTSVNAIDVTISDPALEKLIRGKLVKPTGTLSSSDLESLTQLSSNLYDAEDSEKVKSLEGLEYATNLTELSFLGHSFTDLNPLSTLSKLKRLSIRLNPPINPAPIADLTELVELDLEDSGISNLSFISTLTKLERLYVSRNQIKSLSGIESLSNLLSISASDNQIKSLNPIASLSKLDDLDIRNNNITSLAPLANSTSLTDLGLSDNPLLSLELLSSLTNLTNLFIDEVPGLDFTPISDLTNLNFLTIRYNEIESLSFLSTLNQLQWLEVDNNRIRDPSPLATLTTLTYLQIYANHITDISSLETLIPINGVSLHSNFIDFSAGAPSVNTIALWRDTHGIDLENLDQYSQYFILDFSIPFFQSEPSIGYIQIDSNSFWTATTDASWITLSQASGWETTTLEVTATANGSDQNRTATIDFGDEQITITQRFNSAYFAYLESRNIDIADTSYWPLADRNGNGESNIFEYDAGLDLVGFDSYFEYTLSHDSTNPTQQILSISKRSDGSDFPLQFSTNLENWETFTPSNERTVDSQRHIILPSEGATPVFIRARMVRSN